MRDFKWAPRGGNTSWQVRGLKPKLVNGNYVLTVTFTLVSDDNYTNELPLDLFLQTFEPINEQTAP